MEDCVYHDKNQLLLSHNSSHQDCMQSSCISFLNCLVKNGIIYIIVCVFQLLYVNYNTNIDAFLKKEVTGGLVKIFKWLRKEGEKEIKMRL